MFKQVKITLTKTKYIITNRKNTNECNTIELKVNNEIINPVKSIKYLGIIIDKKKLKLD